MPSGRSSCSLIAPTPLWPLRAGPRSPRSSHARARLPSGRPYPAQVDAPEHHPGRLVDRHPQVPPEQLLAEFVPPPRFAAERFLDVPAGPRGTQPGGCPRAAGAVRGRRPRQGGRQAVAAVRRTAPHRRVPQGVYLDGGFGVGKTHLLASLWHAAGAPTPRTARSSSTRTSSARSASAPTVEALAAPAGLHRRVRARRPRRHRADVPAAARARRRAASRWPPPRTRCPDALGEGRFAADDFLREIQALAAQFEVLRVDGEDYRHRGLPAPPPPLARRRGRRGGRGRRPAPPSTTSASLLGHLAHACTPARYGALLDGVGAVGLTGVRAGARPGRGAAARGARRPALRPRHPGARGGEPLDRAVQRRRCCAGGYRKKYRRRPCRGSWRWPARVRACRRRPRARRRGDDRIFP